MSDNLHGEALQHWLRMILKHLGPCEEAIRRAMHASTIAEKNIELSNALPDIDNALVYIRNQLEPALSDDARKECRDLGRQVALGEKPENAALRRLISISELDASQQDVEAREVWLRFYDKAKREFFEGWEYAIGLRTPEEKMKDEYGELHDAVRKVLNTIPDRADYTYQLSYGGKFDGSERVFVGFNTGRSLRQTSTTVARLREAKRVLDNDGKFGSVLHPVARKDDYVLIVQFGSKPKVFPEVADKEISERIQHEQETRHGGVSQSSQPERDHRS